MNIAIEFHAWIRLATKSFSSDYFDILDQIFPKRVFTVQNSKIEHHNQIQLV